MNYRSLLIVCLATLGLAVAGRGQADGKIAFISHHGGYDDVWIMNADGNDPVNLTQGRYCASPVWSPDGTKIAYIDVDDDETWPYGGEIWLMDVDGSNPQQVTDDSVEKLRLWWSEDGRSLYYTAVMTAQIRDEGWEGPDTFVMALDGSGSSPVDWREVYRRFRPGVSPDGTKQAGIMLREKGEEENIARLYIRDVGEDESSFIHGASFFRVIPLPGLPNPDRPFWRSDSSVMVPYEDFTWAPNSTRVAFTSFTTNDGFREIWAVDIDGSRLVNLTNGLGGHSPAWQPVLSAATSVEAQSWGRIKSLLSTGIR